jgi:ketosteroid isomerase-like protein
VNDQSAEQLLKIEQDFQQAIVENDAAAIERFVADDWIIVGPEGKIIEKERFLGVVKSGALTHERMELEEPRVRVYGETAVVTGRATSAGKFMGAEFKTLERSTDVFVKSDGQWRCVLTQLTRIAGEDKAN